MRNDFRGTGLALVLLLSVLSSAWVTPAIAASGDALPDTWSGVVRLWWESGIPVDSPLHQQADHVSTRYTKRWSLRVVFRVSKRLPGKVTYTSRWASVDYVETSATTAKRGAVSSNEVWRIEAENRILDARECHLNLEVDPNTRQFRIESGGFDIDDAAKSGQIVMEISTRTISEPIDKSTNVIEPVRFEGSYTESRPMKLTGEYDANVAPPPGVDLTHETVGGTDRP